MLRGTEVAVEAYAVIEVPRARGEIATYSSRCHDTRIGPVNLRSRCEPGQ